MATIFFNEDKYVEAEEVMLKATRPRGTMPTSATSRMAGVRRHAPQLRAGRGEGQEDRQRRGQGRSQAVQPATQRAAPGDVSGAVERLPANLAFRFELGQQYKVLGQIGEAIKEFQNARNDARRKGVCLLQLGECFQAIKQYRLAMDHYESAIEEIPDRDADSKKAALYKAGKLALGLNDLAKAEKHLGVVASMDFSYRNVSVLLDKIPSDATRRGGGGEARRRRRRRRSRIARTRCKEERKEENKEADQTQTS